MTDTVAWPLTAVAEAVKATVKLSPQLVMSSGSAVAVMPAGVTMSSLSVDVSHE